MVLKRILRWLFPQEKTLFFICKYRWCFQLSQTKKIQLKLRAKVFDDKRWAALFAYYLIMKFEAKHSIEAISIHHRKKMGLKT